MTISIPGLIERRAAAVEANRNSKLRQTRAHRILRDEFQVVWPNLTTTDGEPAVENIFLEAAEDKAATAASILPVFDVPPRKGTRADRAEREAALARRVFVTLAQRSRLDAHHVAFYLDWFVHGVTAAMPWRDRDQSAGFPYVCRIEPRNFYPLRWGPRGELDEALVIRRRGLADLVREYGASNTGLLTLGARTQGRFVGLYEEIWWADEDAWGIAVGYEPGVTNGDFNYRRPSQVGFSNVSMEWLVAPHRHLLAGCPIVAQATVSADGEIRGKLDAMLPGLKNAHQLQTEANLNLLRNMHAPPLIQNIENEEMWGPDAILKGVRGPDEARVVYPRPPVDYAAYAQVDRFLQSARGGGAFPQQRSGEPGASIVSNVGVAALQGSYNAQQAWAQTDMARWYGELFARLANFDEVYCGGTNKQIDGFDEGEAFSDHYDPAVFWRGDYRVNVSFHAIGVNAAQNVMNLGAAARLGMISTRTAMRRSGLVPNPVAEENDMALERVTNSFYALLDFRMQNGDDAPLRRYFELLDSDKETARSAMIKVMAEQTERAAAQPQNPMMAGAGMPPQMTPALMSLVQ